MPKFEIEITHVSGLTRVVEAEDHDHAMEIAVSLSDESKPHYKYHLESERKAKEIKE